MKKGEKITSMKTIMIPKKVLIIEPTNFKVNKETIKDNSYMQILSEEDDEIHKKVLREHQKFQEKLKTTSVELNVYKQVHEDAYDSIFTCDWLGCIKNEDFPEGLLVVFPMKWPSRRLERNYEIVELLKRDYKYFEDLSFFEEQDLALESFGVLSIDFHNRLVYMNISERCAIEPANYFLDILNKYSIKGKYSLRIIEAYDPVSKEVCFHTGLYLSFIDKTVFFCKDFVKDPRDAGKLIEEFTNGSSSGEEENKELNNKYMDHFKYNIIELSYEETVKMCANVFEVYLDHEKSDRTAIVMSRMSYEGYSKENLEQIKKDYEIIVVDVDTINTCAGGSLRCMSLQVF